MKTRCDFVTNSSSCSYIIAIPNKIYKESGMKDVFGVVYTEQAQRLWKVMSKCPYITLDEVSLTDAAIDLLRENWPGCPESSGPYDKGYLSMIEEEPRNPLFDDHEDYDKAYMKYSAARDEWCKGWNDRAITAIKFFAESNKGKRLIAMEFASDDGNRVDADLRFGLADDLQNNGVHFIMANNS